MPSLGAGMDRGTLVEWLVKPGDHVRLGDVVAVVDTDKTVLDIESFEEGVVDELLVDVDTTVTVGTPPSPGSPGLRMPVQRLGADRPRPQSRNSPLLQPVRLFHRPRPKRGSPDSAGLLVR